MVKNFLIAGAMMLCAGCSSAPSTPEDIAARGPKEGCHTPLGFIPEGRTATGYLHQIEARGQRCQQGVLSCEGGVWTGAYIYPSCVLSP
ncbi:MAG: hypothetical protein ACXVA9_05295 [Bdellovibrionales bacterium]